MHEFDTLFFFDLFILKFIRIKCWHSCFFFPFLFYLFSLGTGSQILIYDLNTGNMIKSFQVFEGIRVHGISCTIMNCTEGACSSKLDFKIAVFGERRVKLFILSMDIETNMQNQAHVSVDLILHQSLPKFNQWVLDVCFLKVCHYHAKIVPVLFCVFLFLFRAYSL